MADTPKPRRRLFRFTLRTLFLLVTALACLFSFAVFVTPRVIAAREAARRIPCTNKVRTFVGPVRIVRPGDAASPVEQPNPP
jgi:hypothetical protein